MSSTPIHANNPQPSSGSTPARTHLTKAQLKALQACAEGISLRFEDFAIVNALLEAGFAEKNVAGVVRVTAEGHRYLRSRS